MSLQFNSTGVLLLSLCAFCAAAVRSSAAETFLGPIPYLSLADSPFLVHEDDPRFFLEDFENDPECVPGELSFCGGGKFDAPNAHLVYGSTAQSWSVDADDGVIDGSGALGASGVPTGLLVIGSEAIEFLFAIEFDADELGFLPNALGFVLTDGTSPGFNIYDAAGHRREFLLPPLQFAAETTSDDRFVGVISSSGIGRLEMWQRIYFSEPEPLLHIDHLQYGLIVPEPSCIALACIAAIVSGRSRRT